MIASFICAVAVLLIYAVFIETANAIKKDNDSEGIDS